MALTFARAGRRRTAALLAGTFLLGGAGATLLDGRVAPQAQAQNLSDTVPPAISEEYAPGFAQIVDRVSPAVVSIQVKSQRQPRLSGFRNFEGSPFDFFEEFEERFGQRPDRRGENDRRDRRRRFSQGQGSGFLISADGYVVTNGHVVSNAEEVSVILQDGEVIDAEVIGVDDKTDLALVKVEAERELPFVTFATRESKVGDWVVAVGNPFGLGGTVTAGIVSARGREIGAGPYDDFIQIDAPINRGNSGGPTFNLRGNVVGVNTAIYSPSGGSVGIGFAIPANIAQDVIDDLRDDGEVTRGWLGVQIQQITPEIAESLGRESVIGTLVTSPQDGSPAAAAGIRQGDAIVAVDGEPVDSPRGLARTISGLEPGTAVALTVWRDGEEQEIEVTLGTLGEDGEPQRESRAPERDRSERDDQPMMMGMRLAPASGANLDTDGLAVLEVEEGSAADEAGIRRGDVILQAAGVDVATRDDLDRGLAAAEADERENVLLMLQRGDNALFVAIPVEETRG